MKTFAKWLILPLLLASTAAQPQIVPHTVPLPVLSQPILDEMLAPIALFPDALLSQMLQASVYPLEVAEAARWSSANPAFADAQAAQTTAMQSWEPSIKFLIAYPQVLRRMRQKLEWMQRLGVAYRTRPVEVMDTIEALRRRGAKRAAPDSSAFDCKPNGKGYLPVSDFVPVDNATGFRCAEPVHIAQRLAGFLNRYGDGVIAALRGRPC